MPDRGRSQTWHRGKGWQHWPLRQSSKVTFGICSPVSQRELCWNNTLTKVLLFSSIFVITIPQAVDLVRGPGEDEAQDQNSSHFDRLYFGFPYQTTHLYNEKKLSNTDLRQSYYFEMFQLVSKNWQLNSIIWFDFEKLRKT